MIAQIFKNENAYDNIIEKYSKMYRVPFALIKAIITRESGFNPKSYRYEQHRRDASYGLMQIMYQTAKGLGFMGKPEDLFDPDTNIKYGTLYLSALLKHYKNIQDAIASYNMGYPRPASKTTELIKKIYGEPQPDWKYANQPYVNYILGYIAYYSAIKKNNLSAAWKCRELILKKRHPDAWNEYKDLFLNDSGIYKNWWIAIPIITILYFLIQGGEK